MELTHKDVKDIIGIIEDAPHLNEIEIVYGGFRLHVHRGGSGEAAPRSAPRPVTAAAPVAGPQASPAAAPRPGPASEVALAANEFAVRAPMVGTFYSAPSPGERPFVEVGQRVKASDDVGVIEVMKLFKTLHADADGTVVRIEVENATLVEFNQVLIVIARD